MPQVVAAGRQVGRLGEALAALSDRHGRTVRVAFEPEPGCVVETTGQAVAALADVDTAYLGVCLDLAHLACAWESPDEAVATYGAAGLPIVKSQVSAALEVADPAGCAGALAEYAEPRFLHQTRGQGGDAYDDLPEALATAGAATAPWRVHFHVPLHAAAMAPLTSTTPVLRAGLRALVGGPVARCDHLEVETYTWGVLPPEYRPTDDAGLVRGIAAELAFTRAELTALGLSDTARLAVPNGMEVA
jgi:hypothetical protein